MKKILLILLLMSIPAICLAQGKVYHNDDLKNGITPAPFHAMPGTKVVTPPPPGPPANLNRPVQQRSFPTQKPMFTVEKRIPVSPAVSRPQVVPTKPSNAAAALERGIMALFAGYALFMLLAIGVPFLIGIICLIDILRNEFTGYNKIIWFILVLLLPLIGSILYFFIGTDQKIRPEDKEEPVVRLI